MINPQSVTPKAMEKDNDLMIDKVLGKFGQTRQLSAFLPESQTNSGSGGFATLASGGAGGFAAVAIGSRDINFPAAGSGGLVSDEFPAPTSSYMEEYYEMEENTISLLKSNPKKQQNPLPSFGFSKILNELDEPGKSGDKGECQTSSSPSGEKAKSKTSCTPLKKRKQSSKEDDDKMMRKEEEDFRKEKLMKMTKKSDDDPKEKVEEKKEKKLGKKKIEPKKLDEDLKDKVEEAKEKELDKKNIEQKKLVDKPKEKVEERKEVKLGKKKIDQKKLDDNPKEKVEETKEEKLGSDDNPKEKVEERKVEKLGKKKIEPKKKLDDDLEKKVEEIKEEKLGKKNIEEKKLGEKSECKMINPQSVPLEAKEKDDDLMMDKDDKNEKSESLVIISDDKTEKSESLVIISEERSEVVVKNELTKDRNVRKKSIPMKQKNKIVKESEPTEETEREVKFMKQKTKKKKSEPTEETEREVKFMKRKPKKKKSETIDSHISKQPTISTRNPPKKFVKMISKLNPNQRKTIEEIGFGSLLSLKVEKIPSVLGYWLVKNYDPDENTLDVGCRKISVTAAEAKEIFGVPMGKIILTEYERPRDDKVLEWFKSQFPAKVALRTMLPDVTKKIEKQTDNGWEFIVNFLMLYAHDEAKRKKENIGLLGIQYINDSTLKSLQKDLQKDIQKLRDKKDEQDKGHEKLKRMKKKTNSSSAFKEKESQETVESKTPNGRSEVAVEGKRNKRKELESHETMKNKRKKVKVCENENLKSPIEACVDTVEDDGPLQNDKLQNRQESFEMTPSLLSWYDKVDEEVLAKQKQITNTEDEHREEQVENQEKTSPKALIPTPTQPTHFGAANVREELNEVDVSLKKVSFPELNTDNDLNEVEVAKVIEETPFLKVNNTFDERLKEVSFPEPNTAQKTNLNENEAKLKRKAALTYIMRSPFVERPVVMNVRRTKFEDKMCKTFFCAFLCHSDVVFTTKADDYVPRDSLESLCPGVEVHLNVISAWARILNYQEKFKNTKSPSRLFCSPVMLVNIRTFSYVSSAKYVQYNVI
ncbi:hypothetical protein SSX86_004027 [Deinandra increscens subsp. villosa]|uniref:Uncharacterized protein n=1 Tax=Deinandra increscens subsp. villosa TaxID=3103831 RepID=A0AAP0DRB7_9ASTR